LSAGDLVDDRFEIAAQVKRGTVSTVYRAFDRARGGRTVALKVFRDLGTRQTARFVRDTEGFASLRHPRIAGYVAHGTWRGADQYLAVEWLEGIDLERRLAQRPATLAEAVHTGIHVCAALEHAHARGVVHGQLKPGHVFLVDGEIERLALLDFVSQTLPGGERSGDSRGLVSAVAYMAPEQARGTTIGPASDVFSLGCLLYRMLANRAAFDARSMGAVVVALLTREPPPIGAAIPPELDALIHSMLAKDPAQRPRDAAATREALRSIDATLAPPEAPIEHHVAVEHQATVEQCPSETRLSEYLEGMLEGEARDAIEKHIDACARCGQLVGAYARAHLGQDDAPPSVAAASLGIGATLGRYTIRDVLGMGGVGIVYLADDAQLGRKVALKLLIDTRRGERAHQRILREARALAQVSHPNVVAVHDAGFFGARPYLVMEYVPGLRLDVWMKDRRRTRHEVIEALLQVGEGLMAAHQAGLVHRDVKPANVIVGDDGRVRVVDFGLVRFDAPPEPIAGFRTTVGAFLGTPYYMPPEQRSGGEVDARADQYSFCVMLFDALYRGARPYDDRFGAVFTTDPSDTVLQVLQRGLLARPEARYADMRALMDDLRAALALEIKRRQRGGTMPLNLEPVPEQAAYLLIARPPEGVLLDIPLHELTHTLVPDDALSNPRIDAARELAERAGGRVTMLPGLLTARFSVDRERPEPAATRAVQCALALLGVLGVPAAAVIADDVLDLTLPSISRAEDLLGRGSQTAVRVDDRVAASVCFEMLVEKDGADWMIRVA
jgi:serine/threonine-protein kinase